MFKKALDEERGLLSSFVKTVMSYAVTGIMLNSILLWLLIDKIGISEYMSPILILIITVPTNFIMNKYWSFKTHKINEKDKCSGSLL